MFNRILTFLTPFVWYEKKGLVNLNIVLQVLKNSLLLPRHNEKYFLRSRPRNSLKELID